MNDPSPLSQSIKRRIKNVVSGTLQEQLNYTLEQVEQMRHLLISKESPQILSNNMSASDDTSDPECAKVTKETPNFHR